jgi:hypothetical protein
MDTGFLPGCCLIFLLGNAAKSGLFSLAATRKPLDIWQGPDLRCLFWSRHVRRLQWRSSAICWPSFSMNWFVRSDTTNWTIDFIVSEHRRNLMCFKTLGPCWTIRTPTSSSTKDWVASTPPKSNTTSSPLLRTDSSCVLNGIAPTRLLKPLRALDCGSIKELSDICAMVGALRCFMPTDRHIDTLSDLCL